MALSLTKTQIYAIIVVIIVVVAACAVVVVYSGDDDDDDDTSGGSSSSGSTSSGYPVTITTFIDYNGNTAEITFESCPERVVVGCNTALNLLLYLGLGDLIVGVYYDEEEVWDEVADEYEELCERIGDVGSDYHLSGNISTDVLLSWEPDLVIGWVSWNEDGLGTEEFFNDNGCNVMSFNTMTSSSYRTLELMQTDYDNVGAIFDVADQTTALYNEIVDLVADLTEQLDGQYTTYYALVDGAVDADDGTIWVYKDTNFIASVLNSMGFTNAFPDGGTISLSVVYEAIGTTNIDLLIFVTYGSVTYENSLASWTDDADLSQCNAIQNGNTIEMKLSCSYGTSPELLDVLTYVYEFVTGEEYIASNVVTITTYTDYYGNTTEITFTSIPERVVVGCSTALNLLLYLGLGDKIVGAYYNEEEVWDEVADEYEELCERIGEVGSDYNLSGNISTDVLLSWEPDLVIGWVSWNENGLGTEEFFNENGCNVMSLSTMCSSDYSSSNDNFESTLGVMETDLQNIGAIFEISDLTDALYDEIYTLATTLAALMEDQDTIYYALVDGPVTDSGTVWVYSDTNFMASVMNSMGFTNSFPDGGYVSLATVYEAIGTTGIDLLVFITYGDVTYDGSIESWYDDETLAACGAIVNGYTIEMKLSCSYGSSPELLDVLQYLYDYATAMRS